ncbi:hypothetical protein C8N25_101299 [Algoriphagus antarcticus]|uniref:Uncharacterized protein n=1 Tax=Algoriphagus antarcticus TaxID=238540 RepID=A0A3E0E8A3_9BACT|nr:hypothetical protein C8N25_101299 [Algoriphagus antarcticus]
MIFGIRISSDRGSGLLPESFQGPKSRVIPTSKIQENPEDIIA